MSRTANQTVLASMLEACRNPWCEKHGQRWRSLLSGTRGVRLDGEWHCSPQCFEQAVRLKAARLAPADTRRKPKEHRIPLGLMLLSRGDITNDQLRCALRAQRDSGSGRVGEWLRRLGAVSEQQVTAALGMQWARPVFRLQQPDRVREFADLLPLPLLETSRMIPVHYQAAERQLYVAFGEAIDYAVLHGIETMLECTTEPCLANQSCIEQALEQIRQQARASDLLFEGPLDAAELGRIARSYAVRLDARNARLARCGEFLWLRLFAVSSVYNLLFRFPSGRENQSLSNA